MPQRLMPILFLGLLVAPALVQMLAHDAEVVATELREPAPVPALPATLAGLAGLPRQCDAFLNDHFGLRGGLIAWNSRLRLALGDSGSPEVAVGRSNWLFLARNNRIRDKYRGVTGFSAGQPEGWVAEMHRRVAWLKARGAEMLFVIVPNKSTVHPEQLPGGWTRVGPPPTDQLVAALAAQNTLRWLDLRPLLVPAAQRAKLYDVYNSHWNDKGSFLAYRAIAGALAQHGRLHILADEDVAFEPVRRSGDLARLLHLEQDLIEDTFEARVLHPAVEGDALIPDTRELRRTGYTARARRAGCARAFILCDSFVENYMIDFLRESFAESHFRHHGGLVFPEGEIAAFRPDVVLYLCAERLVPFELPRAPLAAESGTSSGGREAGHGPGMPAVRATGGSENNDREA